MRIAQKAILVAAPAAWRTVLTIVAAVLSQMAGATNPAVSADRVANWLELDANGEPCEVTLSDGELALVVPPKREGVKRAAIVVQGPGGVTVTLPRGTHFVKPRGAAFDRTRDTGTLCFAVSQDAQFFDVEHSLVYAPSGATVWTKGRGDVVLFLKNGSANGAVDAAGIVVYHEPFARIMRRANVEGDHKYIPVPAIRPSFVEALLEYEQAE